MIWQAILLIGLAASLVKVGVAAFRRRAIPNATTWQEFSSFRPKLRDRLPDPVVSPRGASSLRVSRPAPLRRSSASSPELYWREPARP